MSRPLTPPEDRFISFVNETPSCWEWTGCTLMRRSGNYGRFRLPDRTVYAHRWFWEYINGPVPDNAQLCHTCDNPKCVRLDHMYVGTAKTNSDDKFERNRQYFPGSSKPKISKEEDENIFSLYEQGASIKEIADLYKVHPETIYRRFRL